MKDNINFSSPEDWGISSKESWVSFEELKDNGAPVLEGRDVVGFLEYSSELVPKNIRETAKPGTVYQSKTTGTTLQKQQNGHWTKIDSAAQRMEDARISGQWKGPVSKDASTIKPESAPKPQAKPESQSSKKQKTEETPKSDKESKPLQEASSGRPIGDNFRTELTESNEEYLEKIKKEGKWNGTEFIDLREIVGDQTSVPPRHLDALSRMLVTTGSDKLGWSYIGGDVPGGAGKIYAQAGELMTLTLTGLPKKQADKLEKIVSEVIDRQKASKTKSPVVTREWFQAALNNRIAINNSIKSNHGEGVSIVGGAWDEKGEVEELGMKNYEKDKGFSTDVYFKLSNGELHQPSLKKDDRVNFLNSGAGQYSMFIIKGIAENPDSPYYKPAKNLLAAYNEVKNIQEELGVQKPRKKDGAEINERWNRAQGIIENLSNEEWAKVPEEISQKAYGERQRNRLKGVLENNREDIKKFDIDSIETNEEIIKQRLLKEKGIDPKDLEIKNNDYRKLGKEDKDRVDNARTWNRILSSEAKETAKENANLKQKAYKLMAEKGVNWEGLVENLDGDKLNRDGRKLVHLAAIAQGVPGYKEGVQKEHKAFIANAIKQINENDAMKDGLLQETKNNFPIRDVAEGKEVMAIGDLSLDMKTIADVFGTTDFEVIKSGFKVTTDENGVPYLGWMAKAGEGPLLPIASINVREDGVGYGSIIKHEMVLHPDFAARLRQANANQYGAGAGNTYSEIEMKENNFTEADYLELIKLSRNPEFADSMVFYKGKVLGRCPAGTKKLGKTCAPSQSNTKSIKYKKQSLGGLSSKQVEALSKAKTVEQIIEAHKKEQEQEQEKND
jgi:hypothetical protein